MQHKNVPSDNAALTRRRWVVLAACCLANLCIGAVYAWSVFAGPMAEYLNSIHGTNLNASDLSIAFSIANGIAFLTMIVGGFLDRKIGSRLIIFTGVFAFGVGYILSGIAKSVAVLVLGFGVISGLANGFAYVCTVSNSVKFFPEKKGMVGGISTASFGIGSVIVPPIANALNEAVGVNKAFILLGSAVCVISFLCYALIVNCPDGFVPVGCKVTLSDEEGSASDKNTAQMLRDPIFYLMLAMLFLGSTLGLMVISGASDIAQQMLGMSVASAALVVSAISLCNTGGRILAGWISDKIGRANSIFVVFIAAAVASAATFFSGKLGSSALFCVGICLLGLCYGAFMGIYPGFTSDRFGLKYSSMNYGVMFIGFSSAGFAGPLLLQAIYNSAGAYNTAFLWAAALSVLGVFLTLFYKKAVHSHK